MPNCDFYANIQDHKIIFDGLFEEKECEIYELFSDFEKLLKQFHESNQVLSEFNRHYSNGQKWSSVYIQIYVLGSNIKFIPKKVLLNPDKCDRFKYRYSVESIGLIQLYLEIPFNNSLGNLHTDHRT
jgi:hypothetical protein